MVVAGAVLDLLVVGVDVAADRLGCAEVERCAFYLADLARGDRSLVNGKIEVSIELQLNIVYGRRRISNTC